MRTYVFLRNETVIGVVACDNSLAMTNEQLRRIQARGIDIVVKEAKVAKHDGDMNRLVDTLTENDWL